MDLRKLSFEDGVDETVSEPYTMTCSDNSGAEFSDFRTRGLTSDLDYREIGFKDGRWMQLKRIVPSGRPFI